MIKEEEAHGAVSRAPGSNSGSRVTLAVFWPVLAPSLKFWLSFSHWLSTGTCMLCYGVHFLAKSLVVDSHGTVLTELAEVGLGPR